MTKLSVSSIRFTDALGNTIDWLPQDEEVVFAQTTIKNRTDEVVKILFGLAVYDSENRLLKLTFQQESLSPGEEADISARITIEEEDKQYLKAFIWEDNGSLSPLGYTARLNVE